MLSRLLPRPVIAALAVGCAIVSAAVARAQVVRPATTMSPTTAINPSTMSTVGSSTTSGSRYSLAVGHSGTIPVLSYSETAPAGSLGVTAGNAAATATNPLLQVVVPQQSAGVLYTWRQSEIQGQAMRQTLTLSIADTRGQVVRQCSYANALITSIAQRIDGQILVAAASFAYQSVSCGQ